MGTTVSGCFSTLANNEMQYSALFSNDIPFYRVFVGKIDFPNVFTAYMGFKIRRQNIADYISFTVSGQLNLEDPMSFKWVNYPPTHTHTDTLHRSSQQVVHHHYRQAITFFLCRPALPTQPAFKLISKNLSIENNIPVPCGQPGPVPHTHICHSSRAGPRPSQIPSALFLVK